MTLAEILIKILKLLDKKVYQSQILLEQIQSSKEDFNRAIKRLEQEKLLIINKDNYVITDIGRRVVDDYNKKKHLETLYDLLEARICIRCGHPECRLTKGWCDRVENGSACCNCECEYLD